MTPEQEENLKTWQEANARWNPGWYHFENDRGGINFDISWRLHTRVRWKRSSMLCPQFHIWWFVSKEPLRYCNVLSWGKDYGWTWLKMKGEE